MSQILINTQERETGATFLVGGLSASSDYSMAGTVWSIFREGEVLVVQRW